MSPASRKTIIVASGKGGAGKTSFAVALASRPGPSRFVADCDVAAANDTMGEDWDRGGRMG